MYEHDDHEEQTDEGWIALGLLAFVAIGVGLVYLSNSFTIDLLPRFQGI